MRKGRAHRRRNPRSLPPKSPNPQLGEPQVVVAAPRREILEGAARLDPSPRLDELAANAEKGAASAEDPSSVEPVSPPIVLPAAVEALLAAGPRAPEADAASIPPAGDLLAHEAFFSSCAAAGGAAQGGGDDWESDEAHSGKHEPHVVERRERFARYVKWAVAGASALCLVAGARAVVFSRLGADGTSVIAPAATLAHNAAAPAAQVDAEPAQAARAAPLALVAPAAEVPKAIERPPSAAIDPPNAAPPMKPDDTATEPASGKLEKAASQRALERGKLDEAIAAGERAVAADAEDGEAWLILGAAYQEKGKLADARRCYVACVKQGKRGPIRECSAMLR